MIFILYKFIPEVRVQTRSALLGAAITAVFWEIFKRGFAFYAIHFSAVGLVLSRVLAGTLTSVIFSFSGSRLPWLFCCGELNWWPL